MTEERIVVAGLLHETNGYATRETGLDEFQSWANGEVLDYFGGSRTYVGGMLDAGQDYRLEVVPGFIAEAEPSGPISVSAYRVLRRHVLDSIVAAGRINGVVLALHGAAFARGGIDDVEAELCNAIRKVCRANIPIGASFDLHGNASGAMVGSLDLVIGVKEYPHVDMYDCGYSVVRNIARQLSGELTPTSWIERPPMMLAPQHTMSGPLSEINAIGRELMNRPDAVDITVFHGFPYVDSPIVGPAVVATTNGDRSLARSCARLVARELWDRREELRPRTLDADEAVAQALRFGKWPTVINETSDNPGLGTPGDGTHLLRAMLDAQVPNSCFGMIIDPEAAGVAHSSGVGSTIEVLLGGKHDDRHGVPIAARAYVKCLTDGRFTLRDYIASQGSQRDLGPMARLVIDGVDVLVASRRSQVHDSEVFLFHGIDVRRATLVGLKSSHHFRAGFSRLAAEIISADPPGIGTQRVERLERSRLGRPMWPMQLDAAYEPSE